MRIMNSGKPMNLNPVAPIGMASSPNSNVSVLFWGRHKGCTSHGEIDNFENDNFRSCQDHGVKSNDTVSPKADWLLGDVGDLDPVAPIWTGSSVIRANLNPVVPIPMAQPPTASTGSSVIQCYGYGSHDAGG